MVRKVFMFFVLLIALDTAANDSIRTKSARYFIGINYGFATSPSSLKSSSADAYSMSGKHINCSINKWQELNMNVCFKLKSFTARKTKTHAVLGVGLGAGYGGFSFNADVNYNVAYPTHFPTDHYYSKNHFETKKTIETLSGDLSMIGINRHFYLAQQIGVRYLHVFSQTHINTYDEELMSSSVGTSTAYVTPQNPSGEYIYNYSTYRHHQDEFTFYDFFNPYYNVELGYIAGPLIPRMGFELMYFGNGFSAKGTDNPIVTGTRTGIMFKANAGIVFRF